MDSKPIVPLKLINLSKTYGQFRGIKNLDLEVKQAEILGFLGPNGAGKSTTIRTIMNFQSPSSGQALVFGLDSARDSQKIKSRVGYVSGELAVYEDLTGKQFLEFLGSFCANFKWSEVEKLVSIFQAELGRKLKDLSKGNRQKIGLIQAFMNKPDLIILDEPTSGLDPLMQEEFFKLLAERKANGASIFFSSHNIAEVQRVADRAAFIRDGKLVSIENVSKLRDMNVHRLSVQFGKLAPKEADFKNLTDVHDVSIKGKTGQFVVRGSVDVFIKKLAQFNVLSLDREESNLEDIFLKYYDLSKGKNNHEN